MKNKSALVIGANGMVGTALMKALARSKTYFLIKGVDIETTLVCIYQLLQLCLHQIVTSVGNLQVFLLLSVVNLSFLLNDICGRNL